MVIFTHTRPAIVVVDPSVNFGCSTRLIHPRAQRNCVTYRHKFATMRIIFARDHCLRSSTRRWSLRGNNQQAVLKSQRAPTFPYHSQPMSQRAHRPKQDRTISSPSCFLRDQENPAASSTWYIVGSVTTINTRKTKRDS